MNATNGVTEVHISEDEDVGKVVIVFHLEAYKYSPVGVKANVSLEIIEGKL